MISIDKWKDKVTELHKSYSLAEPFPYMVLDDFFEEATAQNLLNAFPSSFFDKGWIHWRHYNEDKHGLNDPTILPADIYAAINYMNSGEFVQFLEMISGIGGLIADPELEGGGIHISERGGYLNIHSDFATHPRHSDLHRRLNVLLYLNPDWKEEYKGDLEFWSADMKRCEVKIAPLFNRLVIFNTTANSYHGFPDAICCPEVETRKSIALYYYTKTNVQKGIISTNYKTRPGDGLKAVPNWIDNKLLFGYTYLKRKLGIRDNSVSGLLGFKKWFKR